MSEPRRLMNPTQELFRTILEGSSLDPITHRCVEFFRTSITEDLESYSSIIAVYSGDMQKEWTDKRGVKRWISTCEIRIRVGPDSHSQSTSLVRVSVDREDQHREQTENLYRSTGSSLASAIRAIALILS